MSISQEIYFDFTNILNKQKDAIKEIHQKVYQLKGMSTTNTTDFEGEIRRDIKKIKDKNDELSNAYSNSNAPSTIQMIELDRRQKEIQLLKNSIKDEENNFLTVVKSKYSFKGNNSGEYIPTDEMKGMTNKELIVLQKDKINQQDKKIDDITLEVKKGRVLAKEAGHIIDDQNKQLDLLQEDMDRLDNRFKRGIKRFENYVSRQSGCCIIIVLIIELVVAFVIYFILGN